nr:phage tail tape measure protein [Stenotrophomonas sp. MMGLT7]
MQVVLAAIDKATGPLKKILSGSKGVSSALREQYSALKKLEAQQRDIGAFRTQHDALRQSSAALDAQRAKVRELAQQLAAAETPSKKLTNQFRDAQRVAGLMKDKHQQQAQQLQVLRNRMAEAGISTANLGTHERRLRGEVTQANAAIEQQRQRLKNLAEAQRRARSMQSAGMSAAAYGAGMAFAGQRALRAAALPVAEAVQFESAMADVRKVVDFDTPEQFKQMGRDIQDLSMRLPMTQEGIAQIVAAAGQANIPRKELLRFAEDAAKMGVAFDTTAEDAGQTMATWRTAFRMGQGAVVELADKINYLGNTGPASVQKISAVVNRIGALGDVAGLQSGPLAAMASTVAGMGIESEVSATGIKNLLLTLSSGDAATKKQRAAFEALGIDAVDMAKRMQKDAGGSIVYVLEQLRKLPKEQQAATMTQLFGRESIGAIAPLLTNLELLQENFAKVTDQQRYAGSMSAEYASRVATSANAMQLAKNTALALAASLGETLLADTKNLAATVGGLVQRVIGWVREHPKLTRVLVLSAIAGAALVTVLGGLLAVGGLAAMAIGNIMNVVALLSGGQGFGALIGRGLQLAGRVFPMMLNAGRALLAVLGGISWPVLAIGAAIAVVAALVWKYWEPIKAFMIGVWQGIVAAIAPALAELKSAFAPLAPLWAQLGDAAAAVWGWIQRLLTPFKATNEQLAGATRNGQAFGAVLGSSIAGGIRLVAGLVGMLMTVFVKWPLQLRQVGIDLVSGLIDGISERWTAAKKLVTNIGASLRDSFKSVLGIHSPSRVFAQLGSYTMQGLARGLQAGQGGPLAAVAGLAKGLTRNAGTALAAGALASPAAAMDTRTPIAAAPRAAAAAPAGNHYEIHIHAAPGMDPQAIARAVAMELDRREAAKAARNRSALTDHD